jgi:transposase-like protein
MARYSEREKAAALAVLMAQGGNVWATARATGISRRTLARWWKETSHSISEFSEQSPPLSERALAERRGTLEARLASAIDQFVDGLPDKLDEANLQQSVRVLLWLLDHYMTKPETQVNDARERLGHLLDRLAAENGARADPEPVDGG